ncbi:hypothetical protein DICPUDRAFT_158581 [Dictyostelium purpureum]|uniref:Protein kinase domain-containing protein n=1 Tax=Dictyostelium purpureum TaxID=5786 RepID=F1A1Y5_DICPU|nr:uncharacterized protein DICPUDRAFT_158581 [Dictyostelium purpureum]EGC29796.1 hypothetical protein DICPUDRAFT_158581 [Dictyostelium purpureum]|eukprot:XP_003293682.1 hypothetical protein DICPUDRAFT_158581 [Dictyostelium purpureum]
MDGKTREYFIGIRFVKNFDINNEKIYIKSKCINHLLKEEITYRKILEIFNPDIVGANRGNLPLEKIESEFNFFKKTILAINEKIGIETIIDRINNDSNGFLLKTIGKLNLNGYAKDKNLLYLWFYLSLLNNKEKYIYKIKDHLLTLLKESDKKNLSEELDTFKYNCNLLSCYEKMGKKIIEYSNLEDNQFSKLKKSIKEKFEELHNKLELLKKDLLNSNNNNNLKLVKRNIKNKISLKSFYTIKSINRGFNSNFINAETVCLKSITVGDAKKVSNEIDVLFLLDQHPHHNIIKFNDFWYEEMEISKNIFIEMEYNEDYTTLHEYLENIQKPLEFDTILKIESQITEALEHIHSFGIVHVVIEIT